MAIRKTATAKPHENVELRIIVCRLPLNPFGTKLVLEANENLDSDRRGKLRGNKQRMSQTTSVIAIADELSSEIAAAILTRQNELNRDPHELLHIVMTVHDTLRDLSAKARERRSKRNDRFRARAAN
jgi:hypothetical protein